MNTQEALEHIAEHLNLTRGSAETEDNYYRRIADCAVALIHSLKQLRDPHQWFFDKTRFEDQVT